MEGRMIDTAKVDSGSFEGYWEWRDKAFEFWWWKRVLTRFNSLSWRRDDGGILVG
jgi:hypothetical protein